MKIYQFYILKTLLCMTGFLVSVMVLGSDSLPKTKTLAKNPVMQTKVLKM